MKEAIIVFLVAMCVTSLFNGLNLSFNAPSDPAQMTPQASAMQSEDGQTAVQPGQVAPRSGSQTPTSQPSGSQL